MSISCIDRRLGYIATAVLLHEASELSFLITSALKKDITSTDLKVQCLALTLLAKIWSAKVCQCLGSDVLRLCDSKSPAVMKRAAMAAVRFVQQADNLEETFKPAVNRLLNPGAHGVVISATNLMANIICAEPSYRTNWTRYATAFSKILSQLHTFKASREFACMVFNDFFLQIRLMWILTVLDRPSDELDDVLESIVTCVDVKRNTGRALMFQEVEAIVTTAKKPSLRGLAFNQVGRLFNLREATVLYSVLSVFSRVLCTGREIVGHPDGDSIALPRFKTQIVRCLSHSDSSIQPRALDVIAALVDTNNVETLIPEVLDYVKLSDAEFRVELVSKGRW
jgi:hypothetical protein